ncbi:MAG: FAD:protein FMN transferase [Rudaea sp.]|uniref:FAD:protein FMN transferase n=1 Tax=unclassified Rudaea TaxID=2627037 RepID=UPI0010F76C2B|nr:MULTISPECIES: FAD:protein FMN transferase [unclassified Rudaea]MBN8886147.1 FAD:protein FMN transferase [Rudaea sp.]MBR0343845.1 FAD:protein FMN transferase [Rudaea sp.]
MSVRLQRARPWLGTLVEMRVDAADTACARAAIEAAFAEVEAAHRRMSFHEPDSDLSRLHAALPGTAVDIDPRTLDVLRCALELAERSDGHFDPSIAGELVAQGFLPAPRSPFVPDRGANWRDVELIEAGRVRLHRPLWLDLGGIAKGYAVDRAIEQLLAHGADIALVNAGGDLRAAGAFEEIVHLRGADNSAVSGAVAIRDAALATSIGAATRRRSGNAWIGTHFDARDRRAVGLSAAASVIAPTCMLADALTKVVFAAPAALTRRVLDHYRAQAVVDEAGTARHYSNAA